jgi:hypothetical protein
MLGFSFASSFFSISVFYCLPSFVWFFIALRPMFFWSSDLLVKQGD